MSGRTIPTLSGKGQRFPVVKPLPAFWPLMAGLGAVMAPVGVSTSRRITMSVQ